MRKAVVVALLQLAACGGGSTQSATPTPSTQASQSSIDGNISSSSGALTVQVVGTNISTTTDSSGNFALVDVPAGATELHISGNGVDATITISTVMAGEHRTVTITVSGTTATEHHEQSDSEFRGKVQAIDATNLTLTVSGRTVTTSTTTVFSKAGQTAAFTDVAVDDYVEVEGAVQADGSVVATKIEIAPLPPPADTIVFVATVQSNDGTSKLVVGDIPVTVTSTTVIVRADKTITIADLKTGDHVRVKGQLQAGPSVVASEIRDLTPTDVEVHVFGAVTAIAADSTSLTIGDTVVGVDASTTYAGFGDPKSLADFKVGDHVLAEAAKQADGSLLAKMVARMPALPPPPANLTFAMGPLKAIAADNASATLNDLTFKVDASTVFGGDGDPKSLADFKVGDLVSLKAAKQADGSLLALAVMRLPSMPTMPMPTVTKGTISAVSATGLTLTLASDATKAQAFTVDAHTIIRIGDKPGTLADLKVGQTAEIGSVMMMGSTTPLAIGIHVLP